MIDPLTPEEAQQAETVEKARKWAASESAWLSRQELPQAESVKHMDAVLQIVDSQAQKIAEQANELIEAKGANILLNEQNENLRNRVAEQAKEIEQARTIADEWREKAGSKYDPFPWETTDSKEVAR
jgi:regulator of replication initiation timing